MASFSADRTEELGPSCNTRVCRVSVRPGPPLRIVLFASPGWVPLSPSGVPNQLSHSDLGRLSDTLAFWVRPYAKPRTLARHVGSLAPLSSAERSGTSPRPLGAPNLEFGTRPVSCAALLAVACHGCLSRVREGWSHGSRIRLSARLFGRARRRRLLATTGYFASLCIQLEPQSAGAVPWRTARFITFSGLRRVESEKFSRSASVRNTEKNCPVERNKSAEGKKCPGRNFIMLRTCSTISWNRY